MSNDQRKIPKKDKNMILVALILETALLLSFMIYSADFSIPNDFDSLESDLGEHFQEGNIRPLKMESVDSAVFILFTDEDTTISGVAAYEEGLNGKLRFRQATYRSYMPVYAEMMHIGRNDYIVVYGINCDPLIYSYTYKQPQQTDEDLPLNEKTIVDPDFIDIYDDNVANFPMVYLYDENGNDITDNLNAKYAGETQFVTGVAAMETFLVYVFCAGVLFIGIFAVFVLLSNNSKNQTHENIPFEQRSWFNRNFTFQGRMNQKPYFFVWVGYVLLLILNSLFIRFFLEHGDELWNFIPRNELTLDAAGILFFIVLVIYIAFWVSITIYFFCQSVRRLHDFNQFGGWVIFRFLWLISTVHILFALIPLIFELVLLLKNGSNGTNNYGEKPTDKLSEKRVEK
ncbi:DUF805 domain-containing protein [Methanolapillus millepedarum]|uniref:Uncharacterized protein n=1 Tax=Methanolapillus millepedarum TaxID=3028296 RepID=A0AA96ZVR4_9EURY|nr:hypothetical protein MsAc7_06740 [Methanosarcinaceae archaeon Ac7]